MPRWTSDDARLIADAITDVALCVECIIRRTGVPRVRVERILATLAETVRITRAVVVCDGSGSARTDHLGLRSTLRTGAGPHREVAPEVKIEPGVEDSIEGQRQRLTQARRADRLLSLLDERDDGVADERHGGILSAHAKRRPLDLGSIHALACADRTKVQ